MNNLYHKVSEKTIESRMDHLLTEMIPSITASVETENDRVLALYKIQSVSANLTRQAIEKETDIQKILWFYELLNVSEWDLINKYLGDENNV